MTKRVLTFFRKHLRGQPVEVSADPIPATAQGPFKPAANAPSRSASQPGAGRQPAPRIFPKGEWVDPNHDAPNGTKYQTFQSKVLGREVSYLIYLPPAYEQSARRYPVIYWLHGMGGNQRAGAMMFVPQVEAAVQEGALPPTIVVLVNGMVTSFYCDAAGGGMPVESVIVKDLIPHVNQTYRTIARREGRAIEGYSMGGYGAGHLGLKYPRVVRNRRSWTPGPCSIPRRREPRRRPDAGRLRQRQNARRWPNTPIRLAPQNADKLRGKTHIRIGCGSLDDLLPRNQALHEVLAQLQIDHQYEVVPDVAHDSGLYYKKLGAKGFEIHRTAFEGLDKK